MTVCEHRLASEGERGRNCPECGLPMLYVPVTTERAQETSRRPVRSRPSRAWHADWAEVTRDRDGNLILKHKPTGGLYRVLPVEES